MNLAGSLAQLLLAAAILVVSALVGGRLLRWTGYRPGHPVEALCLAVTLGAGGLAALLLVVGLAGLLSGPSCWGVLVAAGVLTRGEASGLSDLVRRAWGELRTAGVPALLAFATVLLVTGVLAGAPVTDWDSLAYHLPVPSHWLSAGAIVVPRDNLHAAYVGLQQLLYLPALAVGADRTPALISTLFAGLLGLTAFVTCDRFFSRRSASLALAVVLGSGVVVMVAMTPRVDTTLALYLLLVHHLVLVAWKDGRRTALLPAAVLMGWAVGIKPLALLYGAALTPFVFWLLWRDRHRSGDVRRRWLQAAGLGVAAAAPWLVKNYLLLGDPVYPHLGGWGIQPWLRPILQGSPAALDVPAEVFDLNRHFRVPFDPVDLFLHPERISDEYEAAFYVPSFLLLFLPLWVLRRRRGTLLLGGPALLFGIGVVVWTSGLVNVRYLVPALVPLTLTAVVVVEGLLPRGDGLGAAAVGAIAVLGLVPAVYCLAGQLRAYPVADFYAGRISRPADYLSRSRWPMEAELGEILRYTNRTVPEEATILMLFDSREFYFQAHTIGGSNIHTSWPLLARAGGGPPCPDEFGATHVLVYRTLPERLLEADVSDEVLRWKAFRDYRRRCLEPVRSTGSHTLYRVAPVDSAALTPPPAPAGRRPAY